MKYRLSPSTTNLAFILFISLVISLLLYSCQGCRKDKPFYYSGGSKIELEISGDTLGILFKDTLLTSGDTYQSSILKIDQALLDSNFTNKGYDTVSRMSDRIRLYVGTEKSKKPSTLEALALTLDTNSNKLAANTGYLVRIKSNNKRALVTNEILVQFNPGTTIAEINDLFDRYRLINISENPFIPFQYTVSTNSNSRYDALKTAQKLKEDESIVRFAQINLIYAKFFNADPPADAYYSTQWQLSNDRPGERFSDDADIDAEKAWNITTGSKNVTIAIIDDGFDMEHDDLKNNFARNSLEIEGNNLDDDHNSLVDDVFGWNFMSNDNRMSGGYHGTQVAGVAAAQDNAIGVRGSCPSCGILPIRTDISSEFSRDGLSFGYAMQRGANIINCSWEYDGIPAPDNVIYAINLATDAGIVVVCSMSNSRRNYCSQFPDLSSLPNTIAVSRSTSKDMYDNSGFGNCMDLLAPTGAEEDTRGIGRIFTTDISGDGGYTRAGRDPCGEFLNNDYSYCFGGTSASAPLTAGVAGLIISASSCYLSPKQIQYLLQDCADKIEPGRANYSKNGFSTGNTESENQSTHGYGRINAYEVVKIISPDASKGGQNGVDVFLRDHNLDWGNTEKPSNTILEPSRTILPNPESVDIKIDASGQRVPTNNDGYENNLSDEPPVGGRMNRAYVRLRNRGCKSARNVTVKLYLAYKGSSLPPLPSDFWTMFPANSTDISKWHPIGTKVVTTIPYSGSSVAGTRSDEAKIISFDFLAPVHSTTDPNLYTLVIMIDSMEDPMVTETVRTMYEIDQVVPLHNNIAYRNFSIR